MWKNVLGTILLALALGGAGATPSAHAETVYTHNGSTMTVLDEGGAVIIAYLFPRHGMARLVTMDPILFRGTRTADHVSGVALIYSSRCGTIPYAVSGLFVPNANVIVLRGAAPVINRHSCATVAYDWNSKHATLVFRRVYGEFME